MERHSRAGGNVRLLRIGESVRHALADILNRDVIQDPDLAGVAVTVTEVQVSSSLRHATCYVVPLMGENQDAVIEALNRAGRFLRGQLGGMIQTKYLPELRFELDKSFDEAGRIADLLASPAVRRDLGAAPEDEQGK